MAFMKAERTQLYLKCALFGTSGSGKTMTALRMAKGIADVMGCSFAVIDTEARSASKYADRLTFDVDNLTVKSVDRYINAMNECVNAGYKVLVIDSLSHAWRELTDEVDRITQASNAKNSLLSWARVNPKQKRLIDTILNFPGHLIVTMRSKTEWVIGEGRNGKIAPEKMGLAPEQGKGIEYEFDLLVELNQHHQATITKDRTGKFQDTTIDKPGEEFGVALYDWLMGGNHPVPPTPKPPSKFPSDDPKTLFLADERKRVIQEISNIITSISLQGMPYYNETEKEEARRFIKETPLTDDGLLKLEDFKLYLVTDLASKPDHVA